MPEWTGHSGVSRNPQRALFVVDCFSFFGGLGLKGCRHSSSVRSGFQVFRPYEGYDCLAPGSFNAQA